MSIKAVPKRRRLGSPLNFGLSATSLPERPSPQTYREEHRRSALFR